MRKFLQILAVSLALSASAIGQISGVYSIPSANYPTIASAIDSINNSGVGTGGVTFNIMAGYIETFPSPTAGLISTTTSSAANAILFQKSGSGHLKSEIFIFHQYPVYGFPRI